MTTTREKAFGRVVRALAAVTDLIKITGAGPDACAIQPAGAVGREQRFEDLGLDDAGTEMFFEFLKRECPEEEIRAELDEGEPPPANLRIREVIELMDALLLAAGNGCRE